MKEKRSKSSKIVTEKDSEAYNSEQSDEDNASSDEDNELSDDRSSS